MNREDLELMVMHWRESIDLWPNDDQVSHSLFLFERAIGECLIHQEITPKEAFALFAFRDKAIVGRTLEEIESALESFLAGFDGFLMKPLRLRSLLTFEKVLVDDKVVEEPNGPIGFLLCGCSGVRFFMTGESPGQGSFDDLASLYNDYLVKLNPSDGSVSAVLHEGSRHLRTLSEKFSFEVLGQAFDHERKDLLSTLLTAGSQGVQELVILLDGGGFGLVSWPAILLHKEAPRVQPQTGDRFGIKGTTFLVDLFDIRLASRIQSAMIRHQHLGRTVGGIINPVPPQLTLDNYLFRGGSPTLPGGRLEAFAAAAFSQECTLVVGEKSSECLLTKTGFGGEASSSGFFNEAKDDLTVLHIGCHCLLDRRKPEKSILFMDREVTFQELVEIMDKEKEIPLVIASTCSAQSLNLLDGDEDGVIHGLASLLLKRSLANSVITANSIVPDIEGAWLVAILYAKLEAGLASHQALSQAQRELLRCERAHLEAVHESSEDFFGDLVSRRTSWRELLVRLQKFLGIAPEEILWGEQESSEFLLWDEGEVGLDVIGCLAFQTYS